MYSRVLFLSLCLFALSENSNAQQLAFPTAEGYGRFAAGGRGGDVYHVTTLVDGNNVAGSLRMGLATVPIGGRTIVFDVGGRIDLQSKLRVMGSHVTIAGQTAPGPGITLSGFNLLVEQTNNVIVRHLRLRPGDLNGSDGAAASSGDALSITDSQNIIVDHISASWSMDETIQAFGPDVDNITIQSSLITESLNDSFHPKGPHGYGAQLTRQVDGGISFHHNLLAHHVLRSPRAGGVEGEEGLRLDFVNNVIYNWGEKSGHSSPTKQGFPEGQFNNLRLNYVGNYLVAGTDTQGDRVDQAWNSVSTVTRIFQDNNLIDSNRDGQLNGIAADSSNFVGLHVEVAERFNFPQIVTEAPEDALARVMAESGATIGLTANGTPVATRDAIDARVVDDFWSQAGAIIDSQADVGGWDDIPLVIRPEGYDTDGDGMADDWERLFGLNPDNEDDRNDDPDLDGYTNLEEFLNFTMPTIPGDYNGDGFVDAADYTTWRDHLGSSVVLPNDVTPGAVDASDYEIWKSAFGTPSGAESGITNGGQVPEPSAMFLAALSIATLSTVRLTQPIGW